MPGPSNTKTAASGARKTLCRWIAVFRRSNGGPLLEELLRPVEHSWPQRRDDGDAVDVRRFGRHRLRSVFELAELLERAVLERLDGTGADSPLGSHVAERAVEHLQVEQKAAVVRP